MIAQGFKYNRYIRHIDVRVYGNAAVVSGYKTGSITWPSGNKTAGNIRFSEVWIKQGGQWKTVHGHASPLEPARFEMIAPVATDGQ